MAQLSPQHAKFNNNLHLKPFGEFNTVNDERFSSKNAATEIETAAQNDEKADVIIKLRLLLNELLRIKVTAEQEIQKSCSQELSTMFSFSFGTQDDSYNTSEDNIRSYLDTYCSITSIIDISGPKFLQIIEFGQKKFEKDTQLALEDTQQPEIMAMECFQYTTMFPLLTVKAIKVAVRIIREEISKKMERIN